MNIYLWKLVVCPGVVTVTVSVNHYERLIRYLPDLACQVGCAIPGIDNQGAVVTDDQVNIRTPVNDLPDILCNLSDREP